MTRWNTFARSAVFAALAAAGWLPWVVTLGPILGVWSARALYLAAVVALYAAGMGPPRRRRFGVALAAGMLGCGLAAVASTATELCLGLAVILGLARSAFLYRATPARAVLTEALLLVGGLLFARFLGGPSIISTVFAIWGFFLVQSFFFLIPGVRARAEPQGHPDPFEHAYQRASAILERVGI